MKVDYYPFRDLSHIIRVGLWKNAFVVRADSPFKKWEDVVDWAKKNPGQASFGSAGQSTATHLAGEATAAAAGVTLLHVPFQGIAPAVTAALGGEIDVPTLNGKVSINIPEGTQSGKQFRLRDKGVKPARGGDRGRIGDPGLAQRPGRGEPRALRLRRRHHGLLPPLPGRTEDARRHRHGAGPVSRRRGTGQSLVHREDRAGRFEVN